MPFRAFEAQYRSGDCYECGVFIVPGDMIGYDEDGNLIHESCHEPLVTEEELAHQGPRSWSKKTWGGSGRR